MADFSFPVGQKITVEFDVVDVGGHTGTVNYIGIAVVGDIVSGVLQEVDGLSNTQTKTTRPNGADNPIHYTILLTGTTATVGIHILMVGVIFPDTPPNSVGIQVTKTFQITAT